MNRVRIWIAVVCIFPLILLSQARTSQVRQRPPVISPRHEGPVTTGEKGDEGEEGEESSLEIKIDPDLDISGGEDLDSLMAAASGKGQLFLKDADVLSGRVVTEGIDMAEGANVYVEEGCKIVSVGENFFRGSLVPISKKQRSAPSSSPSDDARLQPEQAPALACPTINRIPRGLSGQNGGSIEFTLVGNTTILPGTFAAICAGRPILNPSPNPVNVMGTRSADATGGRGGNGAHIEIHLIGLPATLLIDDTVCNEPGADGADANAVGAPGPACGDCGGDARATGGNGGKAGDLIIIAPHIAWTVGPGAASGVTVNRGGNGGNASATGGAGGNCGPQCGAMGGRGGNAVAVGGKAGKGGRVLIAARDMTPDPVAVLTNPLGTSPFVTLPLASAFGGNATAAGGMGGTGGDNCICPPNNQHGGPGGPGAEAHATGGEGADGLLVFADSPPVRASKGVNGGGGGNAMALGGNGNIGRNGANCPCHPTAIAGNGGDGGNGGNAEVRPGRGGNARKGTLDALGGISQGNRGTATATGGNGGNGGTGGSCQGGGLPCIPGVLGLGGVGGLPAAFVVPLPPAPAGVTPGAAPAPVLTPGAPGLPGANGVAICRGQL